MILFRPFEVVGNIRSAITKLQFKNLNVLLNLHINMAHSLKVSDVWLKCATCQMFVETQQDLQSHQQSTHGNIKCQFCSETFLKALDQNKVRKPPFI
jgi:hypothetical protein